MAIDRVREQKIWSSLPPKAKRGVLALKENANVRDGRIYDIDGNDRSDRAKFIEKPSTGVLRLLVV